MHEKLNCVFTILQFRQVLLFDQDSVSSRKSPDWSSVEGLSDPRIILLSGTMPLFTCIPSTYTQKPKFATIISKIFVMSPRVRV